jgi:hypothetical protein
MNPLPEVDWQLLRRLHPMALDRFCRQALAEVVSVAQDQTRTAHDRFLAVARLIEERNGDVQGAFDDLRRLTGLVRLAHLRTLGLLTDEEFSGFSTQTQQAVAVFLSY